MGSEQSMDGPNSARGGMVPGDPAPTTARIDRRRFVQGTVAAAGGLAAAGYIKPGVRTIGVPVALAVSGPGTGLLPGVGLLPGTDGLAEIVEPVAEIVEPVVEIVEPVVEIVEPVVEIVEPVVETPLETPRGPLGIS